MAVHQEELEIVIHQSYMEIANETLLDASLQDQLGVLVTILKASKMEIHNLRE